MVEPPISNLTAQQPMRRPVSLGITGRVAAGFVGVASLTLIASIVAFFSFAFVNQTLNSIEKEGVQTNAQAFTLARQAAEYSEITSRFLAADDRAKFESTWKKLNAKYVELSDTLDALTVLNSYVSQSSDVNTLRLNIASLALSMDRAVVAVNKKLTLSEERKALSSGALRAHRTVIERLVPLIDDYGFDLAIALENLDAAHRDDKGKPPPEVNLKALQAALEALLELQIESNRINALLGEVALVSRIELLPPLRDQIIASIHRADMAAQVLPSTLRMADLRASLNSLLEFGNLKLSILAMREAELVALQDSSALIGRIQKLTVSVAADVEKVAQFTRLKTGAAIVDTRSAIANSKEKLVYLAVTSLILSLLFAWILVGNGLIRRLNKINAAMTSLSEGDLDIRIPHGGNDELSKMAAAVEVFKANAIKARDLEFEKEHVRLTDLKQREASFRLMFEANPLPMCLIDAEMMAFLSVNDAAVAHYGYSREQFLRLTVSDIRPAEFRDTSADFLRGSEKTDDTELTWQHVKSTGVVFDAAVFTRTMKHKGRPAVLMAVIDMTERKRAQSLISHLALHDTLTDLPNRALFRKQLDAALSRRGDSVAVLCLDLDGFKSINDTHGHAAGDQLLIEVGRRIKNCLRGTDTVARLGGDEFAIVALAIERPSDASALAKRILKTLKVPFELNGQRATINTSIGIAISPGDGVGADELLKKADLALYRAKNEGRATYRFFEQDMDARMQERRRLELDLRVALDNGEFELHYQPLVNLDSNEVSAFEALIRWNHPVRGRVSPADFIPLAEETGLIVSIGEWVLQEACIEAASWPSPYGIAINLSPIQFKTVDVVQIVQRALARSGLEATRLEVEITESVLLLKSEATYVALHRLRELGVRIAMDDFGTGYSSLSYLQNFPFDKIKIDRSFIQNLSKGKESVAILHAITSLARTLKMVTTAEGVETVAQLEIVRAQGCTEMQGYLFSPPVSKAMLSNFFEPSINKRLVA